MRAIVRALLVIAFIAACAPAATPTPTPPTAQVVIKDLKFQPDTLQIVVGTTVVWTNRETTAGLNHTATWSPTEAVPINPDGSYDIANALFNLSLTENGGTGSFTFTQPGTYHYFCLPHNIMRGTIVVAAR